MKLRAWSVRETDCIAPRPLTQREDGGPHPRDHPVRLHPVREPGRDGAALGGREGGDQRSPDADAVKEQGHHAGKGKKARTYVKKGVGDWEDSLLFFFN